MADHQPGGAPLLGTVAQIDCLAQCGAKMMGNVKLVAMRDISIEAPFIIADGKAANILVSIIDRGNGMTRACTLTSKRDDNEITHMRATLDYAEDWPRSQHFRPDPLTSQTVSQAQVYDCYFHGPAFQVISRAARYGDAIRAESVTALPKWSDAIPGSEFSPRLIEFGLQTAGLYHLATTGGMLIPKTIQRIDRFAAADIGDGTTYAARAAPARSGVGVDIDIMTSAGAPVASISGYVCEPLPFAHDNVAAQRLAALLNATQPVEII